MRSLFYKNVLTATVTSGTLTTGAVLAISKVETGKWWAGINAIYHMVEGDNVDQPLNYDSVRSLVGCFVNCAAMGGWAVIHETIFLKSKSKNRLANAAIITALAYLIDYHIVPKRYTPGFEKRFSNRGVALGYLAMFIAFAVSHRWKPVPDKL